MSDIELIFDEKKYLSYLYAVSKFFPEILFFICFQNSCCLYEKLRSIKKMLGKFFSISFSTSHKVDKIKIFIKLF